MLSEIPQRRDKMQPIVNNAKAGETVEVKVEDGYKAAVTDANGDIIAVITGTGTFTMPDSDVTIISEKIKPAPTVYYSVSADRFVTLSCTKYQAGDTVNYRVADFYEAVIYVNGRASGRAFTIYMGRKSTGTKITEGVLDADGRFTFEDAGYGKNYTLVIGD